MRILIVDDSPDPLELNTIILQGAGHTVFPATSAHEALELLTKNPQINLVLTDYQMPNMNGVEFVRTLRERGITTPAILMTGYDPIINNPPTDVRFEKIRKKPFRNEELLNDVLSFACRD